MTWIKKKINVPTSFRPKDRIAIAEVLISRIVERSLAGRDKDNKKFPKYSKKYADSKNVGVNDVDLVLSGEMLESIELLNYKKNGEIVIGFDKENEELNGKAEGNITGSYGQPMPNKKKARDFLEIGSKDRSQILSKYPVNDEEKRQERASIMNTLIAEGKTYQARLIKDMAEED